MASVQNAASAAQNHLESIDFISKENQQGKITFLGQVKTINQAEQHTFNVKIDPMATALSDTSQGQVIGFKITAGNSVNTGECTEHSPRLPACQAAKGFIDTQHEAIFDAIDRQSAGKPIKPEECIIM